MNPTSPSEVALLTGAPLPSPGAQRAAAALAAHVATQRDPDDYVAPGELRKLRGARRRATLGLHRALCLAMGALRPDALVEVSAWMGKAEHAAWLAGHIIEVVELNVDEERQRAAKGSDVAPSDTVEGGE